MSEEEVQSIKGEIGILKTRIENVLDKVDGNDKKADDWRTQFCKKLDAINTFLETRPCMVHETKLKSIDLLWDIIRWVIPSLIILAVAWGALITNVYRHEVRIGVLEDIHPRHEVGNGKMQT